MKSGPSENARIIREAAMRLGFSACGFSAAAFLEEEAPRLEQWLLQHRHGRMGYMEKNFDERLDPRKLVDGAKSVVSLLYNYFPAANQEKDGTPLISKYAYGEDYHFVVKDKLYELLSMIRDEIGEVNGRVFVDSAPVLEKAWAKMSGLGWIGKNANLITRQNGSFFFIAELVIDLEIQPDGPIEDFCGTCTRCIDACPTEAIIRPYVVDGSKCISYFTIELKEEIPSSFKGQFGNWAFGCDICQDVCPWNRFAKPHQEPRFGPRPEILSMNKKEWVEMTEETFRQVFRDSAVKRTGYKGLKRNLDFIRKTS